LRRGGTLLRKGEGSYLPNCLYAILARERRNRKKEKKKKQRPYYSKLYNPTTAIISTPVEKGVGKGTKQPLNSSHYFLLQIGKKKTGRGRKKGATASSSVPTITPCEIGKIRGGRKGIRQRRLTLASTLPRTVEEGDWEKSHIHPDLFITHILSWRSSYVGEGARREGGGGKGRGNVCASSYQLRGVEKRRWWAFLAPDTEKKKKRERKRREEIPQQLGHRPPEKGREGVGGANIHQFIHYLPEGRKPEVERSRRA